MFKQTLRLAAVGAAFLVSTASVGVLTAEVAGATVTYTISVVVTTGASNIVCPTQLVITINTDTTTRLTCSVTPGGTAAAITFVGGGAILRHPLTPTTVTFVGTVRVVSGTCSFRPNGFTPEVTLHWTPATHTVYRGTSVLHPIYKAGICTPLRLAALTGLTVAVVVTIT